jgi:hypothetical protein
MPPRHILTRTCLLGGAALKNLALAMKREAYDVLDTSTPWKTPNLGNLIVEIQTDIIQHR